MSEDLTGTGVKDPMPRKHLEPGDRPNRPVRGEEAQPMACRENAAGLLQRKIDYHHHRAAQLESLRDALPRCLPPAADEALWSLLHNEKW